MRTLSSFTRLSLTGVMALVFFSVASPAATLYGVSTRNNLVVIDTANPGSPTVIPITGLAADWAVRGIDFRPANGVLYGISRNDHVGGLPAELVTIDPLTGVAAVVASLGISFGQHGISFDPVADQLVVHEQPGRRIQINPNGTVVSVVNQSITYAPGDVNAGSGISVEGMAYTNNFAGGSAAADLLAINCGGTLISVDPNGQAGTIGSLGLGGNGGCGNPGGFAIQGYGLGGSAWAVLTVGTVDIPLHPELFLIDLQTGAAIPLGALGPLQFPSERVMALAVAPEGSFTATPEPGTLGLVAVAAALAALHGRRRCS